MIRFECGSCGADLKVEERKAGTAVRCPSCQERITVPAVPGGLAARFRAHLLRRGFAYLLPLCAFSTMLTWESPKGPRVMVAALSWFLGGLSIGSLISDRLPSRFGTWARAASVALGFCGLAFYWSSGWIVTVTVEPDGDGKVEVWDYFHPRSHRICWRKMISENSNGGFLSLLEGGYSESGKKHGRWAFTSFRTQEQSEDWYWYDEKVSEGGWHRLSGK